MRRPPARAPVGARSRLVSDAAPLPELTPPLAAGDAVIVIPPFAGLDRPSLAAHVVQACARVHGFDVRVLYANMLLARAIGEANYPLICFASTSDLIGERFFACAAYGVSTRVCGGEPSDESAL